MLFWGPKGFLCYSNSSGRGQKETLRRRIASWVSSSYHTSMPRPHIVPQKSYRDFRLQGVLDAVLSSKNYQTVYNRLTVEEATAAVKASSGGGGLQGVSMRDSDQEDQDEG